jgi:hypothetical protein
MLFEMEDNYLYYSNTIHALLIHTIRSICEAYSIALYLSIIEHYKIIVNHIAIHFICETI